MFDLAATCPIDILCGVNDRNMLLQGLGYSRVLTIKVLLFTAKQGGAATTKGRVGLGSDGK